MTDVTDKMKRDFINAAWNGQTELMNKTLEDHPDAIHWRLPGRGSTALAYAVVSGNMAAKSVALMLEKGADVNARDEQGRTALMEAADHDGVTFTKVLLENGADTTLRDNVGLTAADIGLKRNSPWSKQVAGLIAAHEANLAEKARAEQALRHAQTVASETAQAHQGLDHRVAVGKPLAFRPSR